MPNNLPDKGSQISEVISKIVPLQGLDSIPIERLEEISKTFFNSGNLCECTQDIDERIDHVCKKFYPQDSKHIASCRCCQTQGLREWFARFLERLNAEGRLPQFTEKHLSRARIRDRSFNLEKEDSKLRFKIIRHLNAWSERPGLEMEMIVQTWEFDFDKLALEAKE
jgi:hypothetical protein